MRPARQRTKTKVRPPRRARNARGSRTAAQQKTRRAGAIAAAESELSDVIPIFGPLGPWGFLRAREGAEHRARVLGVRVRLREGWVKGEQGWHSRRVDTVCPIESCAVRQVRIPLPTCQPVNLSTLSAWSLSTGLLDDCTTYEDS